MRENPVCGIACSWIRGLDKPFRLRVLALPCCLDFGEFFGAKAKVFEDGVVACIRESVCKFQTPSHRGDRWCGNEMGKERNRGFKRTFKMLHSQLILVLQLLHLLQGRIFIMFLVVALLLRGFTQILTRVADQEDLRISVVQKFGLQGGPAEGAEFI